MKARLFITAVLLLLPAIAKGEDFEALRALTDNGSPEVVDILSTYSFAEDVTERLATRITKDMFLEGIVVGCVSSRGANTEIGWQQGSRSVSAISSRVAYIESPDGRYGFKLFFNHGSEASSLKLFGNAKLNLKGCVLYKEGNCYTIANLTKENIVSSITGASDAAPEKIRTIEELTDDDLNTFVTVRDCEFVSKNGAYINVWELPMLSGDTNRGIGAGWMDSWRRLIADKNGKSIYVGVNSKVPGRRDGKGVPQGNGNISGILTSTYMPRYGKVAEYTIRPLTLDDIAFDSPSAYSTIAAWDWNSGLETLDNAGQGEGKISTEVPCRIGRFYDYDNTTTGNQGRVNNGALAIDARLCDWWDWSKDEGRSLCIEFSTEGISGDELYLAYSFSAGRESMQTSTFYPAWWQVSYSTDGKNYTIVPGSLSNMRSLPYVMRGDFEGHLYEITAEAGIGYTEHICFLPKELFGKQKVTLKISPACKVAGNLSYLHRDNSEICEDSAEMCYVNFGEILVKYR